MRNNRVGMKDACRSAGANTKFRIHRLLSLPALKDLASDSSPPLNFKRGKTKETHTMITQHDCLCGGFLYNWYCRDKLS